MKTIGTDGCKSGWFSVSLSEASWETAIHKNIQELWLSRSGSESILIDIPIGFRKTEPLERLCDLAARKVLGPGRGSSVFPTPCRAGVYCSTYEAAHLENKRSVDRGLSKQTWAIVPKIQEVDAFLRSTPESLAVIRESHPEVAFWGLNGRVPLEHGKKTTEGLEERIQILLQYDERAEAIYQASMTRYLRKDAASDDIIDALCLAVTGQVMLRTEMRTLPAVPETDEYGIPMQIVFATSTPHLNRTQMNHGNSKEIVIDPLKYPTGASDFSKVIIDSELLKGYPIFPKLIEDPNESEVMEIRERIIAFNLERIEDKYPHDFIIRYGNDQGKFIAGICFSIHGEWLEIDFLIVDEKERTEGLGSKLLKDAEALAVEKNCSMSFLTTFGFQARPFYEKHGYSVVYEQKNYPRTGSKYFMEKRLG